MQTALFSLTLLLSAFLLFWVQPMVGKMVLPLLGGSPSVWNACLMFFQAVLLAGYGYVYFGQRVLRRWQPVFHAFLLLVALLLLPIQMNSLGTPPLESNPIPWLLLLLGLAIGLPLFIISATAPLLQFLFSKTAQKSAKDPYFLYSASNLGSMLALLSYPFFLEPRFNLVAQNWGWSFGFGLLAILIISCIISVFPNFNLTKMISVGDSSVELSRPDIRLRIHWIFLAFAPSSLLVSTTTILTTNISVVPLFWIIPLALYILTFIIVFAKHSWISHAWVVRIQPFILIPLLALPIIQMYFSSITGMWILFAVYLGVFFVTALLCHGELVRLRPQVDYLTEFYLWIAVGGLLGRVFNVLLAPVIFKNFVEYPLVLALACSLRPQSNSERVFTRNDLFLLLLLGIFLYGLNHLNNGRIYNSFYALAIVFVISFSERSVRFGLGVLLLLLLIKTYSPYNEFTIFQARNFFGTIRVTDSASEQVRFLVHGSIMHGVQSLKQDSKLNILSYYSPLKTVFTELNNHNQKLQIAVVGLGAGTIACYSRPQDVITFYEIDPQVTAIAQKYFTFLKDCAPQAKIVMGDGRLSLMQADPESYQIIILDAFSADAIPVHMITEEAIRLYLQKLTPQGLLLFNVSNQYLNLGPMLANMAKHLGLAVMIYQNGASKINQNRFIFPSTWIVMARQQRDINDLENYGWRRLSYKNDIPIWTDNFSNILSVIR